MIDKGIETQNTDTEDFEFLKQYFNDLGYSDSDKILKTHCLVYLTCKYPSNTKAKDDFLKKGADLKAAEELLQSLKEQKDLNLYLKDTFNWDSLFLLKTILLLGADFGRALIGEAQAGKTERVKLLLAADKKTEAVNAKDQDDYTALVWAAGHGHTEAVQALLAHNKIDANVKGKYGYTALMWAACNGQREAIQALLTHDKINVNATNNDGYTALMWAAFKGHAKAVQALLVHNNVDVNAKDDNGWTALMRAALKGHTEAVKELLAHNNIDVNAKNKDGETSLMWAAGKGRTYTVKALLTHSKIDVNVKNNNGWTALMWATLNGHIEAVKELLAHNNIDVNAKDNNDLTALMYAEIQGHTEAVQALLAHNNIDVNAKDNNDLTALMYAEIQGHTEIENLLKTQNTKNSVTKKSLFSGAFTASLFAAIAATVSFGLKLPLFTILGGPLVFIALAAVAGFIVGAGLAVAITAYSNKNAMVENTDNRTHRESTPNVSSNNTVINAYSARKDAGTGVANGQAQKTTKPHADTSRLNK